MDSIIKDTIRTGSYSWVLMGTNYICHDRETYMLSYKCACHSGWYLDDRIIYLLHQKIVFNDYFKQQISFSDIEIITIVEVLNY